MLYFFGPCLFLCVLFFFVSRLFRKLKGVEEKPSSDNNAPQIKYDVFVSFRGKDIRQGLLSHLIDAFQSKKIDAFVDDKNLKAGEEIWSSLVGAIEGSSILLIIFSPGYASSRWCLEELVKIFECKEKYKRIIIPIFYHVEPTDVRHQSGSYKSALAKHERKHKTKVQHWRRALKKSADLSGIESPKFRKDAEVVKEIVNLLLQRLVKPPIKSKGLVGIDKVIEDVESLISKKPKDTCLIGIWGMGGLGKTTLVEEVFNKIRSKYEGGCFLANEREQSIKHGITSLREIFFSELLGYNVKIDTPNSLPGDIIRKLGSMKVLIVLDDVNDLDHIEKLLGTLDYFGSGSRIIVTTRDEQVLKANEANEIYKLGELSSDKALDLFNLNAFNQSQCDCQRDYNELSKRMVHYAQGIPLVLKVLARLLRGKNREVWESQLNKLKRMPLKEVYNVMKLSYDDLDCKEQQIFLDLACFFVRLREMVNVETLKSLLKDGESDDSVLVVLERLKDKALITFSEDNFVTMHDSLQEMAWEIVRQESIEDPGSRSRLWDPNDIYEALKNDKVTEAIRSIQLELPTIKDHKSIHRIFAKMSRLQFLDFSGKYYYDCVDQHHILAEGLQFLATELRFLYWCHYPLKSLPENFSTERLVILSLKQSSMEKLWDGVKNLVNLKKVDLSESHMLKELPDLSKAINLEVLILRGCSMLTSVHASILSLAKLEKLYLCHCRNLTQLGHLKVSEISLQTLPRLPPSLKTLDVTFCESLQTLPELSLALETLQAGFCTSLEALPKLPPSLKTVDVRNCILLQTLPELPMSIETLGACVCTSLQTLPKLPQSLKTVDVSYCKSLQILPQLPPSLKDLNVRECKSLQSLPELPRSLETLDFTFCRSLQTLPELPRSHETLDVCGCTSLQTLPELSPSLKTLNASICESLQTLAKLPLSLITLDASSCCSLQSLPQLPKFLKTLQIRQCQSLKSLPELPPSLEILVACSCSSLQTIPELPLFLKTLNVSRCKSLQSLPKLPPSLQALDISDCRSLHSLPELPPSLKTLNAVSCISLQTPKLPLSLKSPYVPLCYSLQSLPEPSPSLETLNFRECKSLRILPEFPLSLKTLDVQKCKSLQSLPELPPSLKTLDASHCKSLKTVLFPSTAVEQLKENRKRVLFLNCLNLDEHSLVAIELNAQINVKKFANQHLSTLDSYHVEDNDYRRNSHSNQAVYMYPGSSVPRWLEYMTTNDYIIIDLSSAPPSPPLGFVYCFVLGKCQHSPLVDRLEVNITIRTNTQRSSRMYIDDFRYGTTKSDHVCVLYDQTSLHFLNSRAENLTRFKIQVTMRVRGYGKFFTLPQVELKGFGVSPISTSANNSFIQQIPG